MTIYKSCFYSLALLIGLSSCDKTTIQPANNGSQNPPVGTTTQNQVIDGNTQFAINIYKEVVNENENQIISPYSISTALAMAYAGTDGNTSTEIQNVFGFGANNSSFHQSYNQVTNTIKQNINNAQDNEINIINKIWRNTGFHFLPTFENIMNTDYLSPVVATDFLQAAAARQEINTWVGQQTKQLIPELLPNGFIKNNTRTILVNAIYFKADWEHQFNSHTTQPQTFKTTNTTVTTDMMSDLIPTNHLRFTEDTDAEVLELFFKDKQSSIVIVLPKDQTIGINNFVQQNLSKATVDQWFNDLTYPTAGSNFSVQIPKWNFNSDFDLINPLKNMGVHDLFSINANLSKMAEGVLYVDAIKHKAVIEAHEGGIEAAASTAIGIGMTSLPPVARTIKADRPFVFMVKDTKTNSILFIGHVQDPS